MALATKRDAATYRDILASNAEEFQRLARMVSDMLFLARDRARRGSAAQVSGFPSARTRRRCFDFYEAVAEKSASGCAWRATARSRATA